MKRWFFGTALSGIRGDHRGIVPPLNKGKLTQICGDEVAEHLILEKSKRMDALVQHANFVHFDPNGEYCEECKGMVECLHFECDDCEYSACAECAESPSLSLDECPRCYQSAQAAILKRATLETNDQFFSTSIDASSLLQEQLMHLSQLTIV